MAKNADAGGSLSTTLKAASQASGYFGDIITMEDGEDIAVHFRTLTRDLAEVTARYAAVSSPDARQLIMASGPVLGRICRMGL